MPIFKHKILFLSDIHDAKFSNKFFLLFSLTQLSIYVSLNIDFKKREKIGINTKKCTICEIGSFSPLNHGVHMTQQNLWPAATWHATTTNISSNP
jgi:hypothetical protein